MMGGWMLRVALVVSVLALSGCAVRTTVGAHTNEPTLPALAAERSEVCVTYSQRLDRTRIALQRRNAFGRLDLLRAEHRAMEQFVEDHCS